MLENFWKRGSKMLRGKFQTKKNRKNAKNCEKNLKNRKFTKMAPIRYIHI